MANAIIFLSRDKHLKHSLDQSDNSGLILEFGVFQGKSISLIANHVSAEKIVYGFDSFEGLPSDWSGTEGYKKDFKTGIIPTVPKNVILKKGLFEDTLPKFIKENKDHVSFLHIDSDLYSSAKTILDNLSDRFVNGTIIVFDEYFNYPNWQNHEFKAFQEFILSTNLDYEYVSFTNSKSVTLKIKK